MQAVHTLRTTVLLLSFFSKSKFYSVFYNLYICVRVCSVYMDVCMYQYRWWRVKSVKSTSLLCLCWLVALVYGCIDYRTELKAKCNNFTCFWCCDNNSRSIKSKTSAKISGQQINYITGLACVCDRLNRSLAVLHQHSLLT